MTPTAQTGIWLYPDAPVADLVDAVVAADQAGIDEIWIADEGVARDPMVVLSAAASRTRRIRLGVGITSPVLRHPGALAPTIATLDELSGGRAMLGLGVGGTESLDPFGLTYERPIALMRRAVETARSVIERRPGEHYQPPRHAAPARQVPIYLGARGEQMNRLASKVADGVFLSGFALDGLAEPVGWARSTHPVAVALYASVRFRSDAPADPTALIGAPDLVTAGLAELVGRHQPHTIGLALVDGDPVPVMMERAIAALGPLVGEY